MSFVLLSSVICFAAFILSKWTYFHLRALKDRGKISVALFLIYVIANGICIGAVCLLLGNPRRVIEAEICGIVSMACLYVVYAPFYYTIATSLSVQTLVRLYGMGGSARLEDLTKEFGSTALVRARLETMERNGYLVRCGNAHIVTEKGIVVARLFSTIKDLLRLGAGG